MCNNLLLSLYFSHLGVHWHKASLFLWKREIQDGTNPGIVGSSLISVGRNLVMPVQFLFSKASLASGQLPPCDLSRFIISHSSLSAEKTDQGVVSNWGFWKSPSCIELQVMDFKNKLGQSGRYLLVQEVTHREFNWIHPKWIGQESRSSVTAKVFCQHFWGMPWPGVCLGAALSALQLQDGFLPYLLSLHTSHQAGCIANSSWKGCLPQQSDQGGTERFFPFTLSTKEEEPVSLFIAGLPLFF